MVQIMTDSSVLYTKEQAKEAGFEVVPLCVSIDDIEGRDTYIDMDRFYEKIKEGHHPKSSQPPIGEVVEAYEKWEGDEIINISMADGLSGTYQSACMAKGMVEHSDKITVINSKTLCGPHRYMVEKAQKMKEAGHSAKEIIAWLNDVIEKQASYLIPQDFNFLRRGGRLTRVAAALGSILKLKPIMVQTSDGKQLDKLSVKRTMRAAVREVIDHMKQRGVGEHHIVYISHARALKDAMYVKEQVEEHLRNVEVRILELGAAFVTQGGPQCVAIQYIER